MKEFIAIIMISAALASCRSAPYVPDPPADDAALIEIMYELRDAVFRQCVFEVGEW